MRFWFVALTLAAACTSEPSETTLQKLQGLWLTTLTMAQPDDLHYCIGFDGVDSARTEDWLVSPEGRPGDHLAEYEVIRGNVGVGTDSISIRFHTITRYDWRPNRTDPVITTNPVNPAFDPTVYHFEFGPDSLVLTQKGVPALRFHRLASTFGASCGLQP